ncbi:MAG: 3-methyl-2-oxobutanoate hydroxymethyltransferase [Sedimentisphaerales bacterium]|nr:3-methyl-2-oxobutanoate hydroxymethyltransferase [Sedimentisphaerales bacterium]
MNPRITLKTLCEAKKNGRPISMITCYDFATAILLEQAGTQSLLVGDTLAQVILGHDTTLPVTMDTMIALTAAVRRGAPNVFLVGDMPFLSYTVSTAEAISNAGRFMAQAGCDAVKVEVDHRHLDVVAALDRAGIPVMAHLGLRPQAIRQTGLCTQGRTAENGLNLIEQAQAMVRAGAQLLLLECVTAEVAGEITRRAEVPVISCGSGPECDGQVLVLHDLLGLPQASGAKFTKAYAQIGKFIEDAAKQYVTDVHERRFPDTEHSYHISAQEHQRLKSLLDSTP